MKKASTVLVLISNDASDILAAVEQLLEPYYMWRESPAHKQYLELLTLQNVANQYELQVSDLEAIAASLD